MSQLFTQIMIDSLARAMPRPERQSVVKALIGLGREAVQPLLRNLASRNWHIRHGVVLALGGIGDPAAITPLIQALADPKLRVRGGAVKALIRMGETVEGAMVGALEHGDWRIREGACHVLGSSTGPRTEPFLLPLVKDPEPLVRKAAVAALGGVGGELAVEAIITAAEIDPHPWVRTAARQAFVQLMARASRASRGREPPPAPQAKE